MEELVVEDIEYANWIDSCPSCTTTQALECFLSSRMKVKVKIQDWHRDTSHRQFVITKATITPNN